MHLYFIVRGIRQQVELFEKFMQTQMFAWERTDLKTQKVFNTMVQGAYRDCGMFKEYVFPENSLKEVLDMLNIKQAHLDRDYALSRFKRNILRKMLGNGVKAIPKYDKIPDPKWRQGIFQTQGKKVQTIPHRHVESRGVACHLIGIKYDKYGVMQDPDHPGGIYQELL